MDAAAALLDARCLNTFANTGDCAAWRVCNDANNKPLGKNTRLISSLDPLKNKQTTHMSRYGDETQTTLRAAWSPSERGLCNHRFVVDCGRRRVVAIFLVAHASGCHFFDGEEFLCGSHQNARKMFVKHSGSETNDGVVPGCWCGLLRGCRGGESGKSVVLSYIFQMGWGLFINKGAKIEDAHVGFGLPFFMRHLLGKRETRNARSPELPGHPAHPRHSTHSFLRPECSVAYRDLLGSRVLALGFTTHSFFSASSIASYSGCGC